MAVLLFLPHPHPPAEGVPQNERRSEALFEPHHWPEILQVGLLVLVGEEGGREGEEEEVVVVEYEKGVVEEEDEEEEEEEEGTREVRWSLSG